MYTQWYMIKAKNRIFILVFIVVLCLFQSGCATLGDAAGGLAGLTTTLVKLPFDILGMALDIASKMPMPPPGLFF